jgi:bla regulator protein BlaR1
MNEVLNHLLQSTLFAAAVGVANTTLRRNSPRLRYWLWLAASAKFLVPFSLLVSTGARIQLPPDSPSLHAVTVQQISTYIAPFPAFSTSAPATVTFGLPQTLVAVWVTGALFLAFRWFWRWRMIHSAVRRSTNLPLPISVPARSSTSMTEPGVFGVFAQVLLLPEGLADTLTPRQFEAILAHELRHIRYRDNLTAALHMCVETLFWFHPLVWWIGAQLMAERERDCDEAVLMQGGQPGDYARGIVQVCEAYVESPLACASGVSGSDLKKRIREIMTWRGSLPVTLPAKVLLAAAAFAVVSIPFAIGILRAQTLPPAPAYTYDAVSVHKSESGCPPCGFELGPQGGLRTTNTSVMQLLTFAYGVRDYQFSGAPRWASSDYYDIVLTPGKAEAPLGPDPTLDARVAAQSRNKQRLQAVLRDRFGLVLRTETHELPIYLLTQAKGGVKLTVHPEGEPGHYLRATGPGHMEAVGIPIKTLANNLSNAVGRPVTDGSGLTGQYDFKLDWTPDLGSSPDHSDDTTGPSIFTALADQLGLRLTSTKGPVQVYVIEKIEHPSEN